MRILLLLPDGRIHRIRTGRRWRSLREAPLTLTSLAALVPSELGAEIHIVDESIDPVPTAEGFDLVGISVLTGTAARAYDLADRFRASGATVVLGGVHVSLLPEEAAAYADAIVTGFAERTWPRLLRDFAAGRLERRYNDSGVQLADLPRPRRDLQRASGYMMPNTVFATRGCKGACDFCSVPAAGFGWQTRPVAEVVDEIAALPGRRFAFSDVSLTEDRAYACRLFTALKPLGKRWGGLATTRIGDDPELLDLMAESGCRYLLIGFESFSTTGLAAIRKGFNDPGSYSRLMAMMHDRGIVVQGCFVFGFDSDGPEVFESTVAMVDELRIDIPRYAIYTPYPGTRAYERLAAEGRLLHRHWPHYDTQHVVFRPAQMSPDELDEGFRWAYRRTFGLRSMVSRTVAGGWWFPVTLVGNLAYRRFIARLQAERGRLFKASA